MESKQAVMRFKQLCGQILQEGSAIRAGGAGVSHRVNAAACSGCEPDIL